MSPESGSGNVDDPVLPCDDEADLDVVCDLEEEDAELEFDCEVDEDDEADLDFDADVEDEDEEEIDLDSDVEDSEPEEDTSDNDDNA